MIIICPKCLRRILSNEINIAEDIFFCQNCNEMFHISEILNQDEYIEAEKMLLNPPKGTWIHKNSGQLTIGVSTHSKNAFILFPFALVFSFVSFFAFGGTLIIADISIIFSLLWLVFVIPSCILIWKTTFAIFGKIEITFSQNTHIFIGIGRLGKKIYINWKQIKSIIKSSPRYIENDGGYFVINEMIVQEEKYIKIPTDDISDIKKRFLYLLLKYHKHKKIEDIVR